MESNLKILLEDLMKQMRDEIKQSCAEIMTGFVAHVGSVDKRFSDLAADEVQRDTRVAAVETVAASIDSSFTVWKPQVEESLHSVRLELSKLNSFFNRDAWESNTTKPRVLSIKSA
jgi:hypothetical protein